MSFSTKEKLALREAIHAMKWLDNGKLTTNVDKDLLKYWQITEGVDGNRR